MLLGELLAEAQSNEHEVELMVLAPQFETEDAANATAVVVASDGVDIDVDDAGSSSNSVGGN